MEPSERVTTKGGCSCLFAQKAGEGSNGTGQSSIAGVICTGSGAKRLPRGFRQVDVVSPAHVTNPRPQLMFLLGAHVSRLLQFVPVHVIASARAKSDAESTFTADECAACKKDRAASAGSGGASTGSSPA
eukprot:3306595-Rhodomonas_salina.1